MKSIPLTAASLLILSASWQAAYADTTSPTATSTPTPMATTKPLLTPAQTQALKKWSDALALNAAVWGSPAVIMYNLRYHDALSPQPKAAPNSIWRMEDISTPTLAAQAGYVTPNVNVVYGFGFLDLGAEPIILSVPDSKGRYYMVEIVDMWTNAFAYAAGADVGYKGGKFALVAPGWQGTLPADVKRINSPTRWVLIQPRVHVLNAADLPAAKQLLQAITVQGLSAYEGKTALPAAQYHYAIPHMSDPKLPVSSLSYQDPLQFWEILSASLNENPPPIDQLTALLPLFKVLGIEYGKPWDRSKVNPITLAAMQEAAQQIGPLLADLPVGHKVNGWFLPPLAIGNSQTSYGIRAIVARIGLTANTPQEAIYYQTREDSNNNPLMGSHHYTITFTKTPPFVAPGFWSLTMYNSANYYTVANPINRYFLGSDSKMKYNADGSLTLYIQQDNPGADKESNWLPAPAGEFYLILRSYAPGAAMIESLSNSHAYTPPPVILTQ